MKPTDFYKRRYMAGSGTKNKGKRLTGISADFAFYNGSIDMAFLNQLEAPDASAIAAHQINWIKQNIQINQNIKNFINSFKKNRINLRGISVSNGYNLEDALSDIEKVFLNVSFNYDPTGNLQALKTNSFNLLTKNNTTFNINSYIPEYQQLFNELVNVEQILTQDEAFISSNDMNVYMQKISNLKDALAADLAKISMGQIVPIPNEPYISPGALADMGRKIKGRLMELGVKSFLSDNLPSNLKVIDTSLIRDRHQLTAGADLIIIEAPSGKDVIDNIKISWKDKNGTHTDNIFNFFDYVSKNKDLTIRVDTNEYNEALKNYQANITGLQAKSGFNQGLLNKNKANSLTLQKAISAGGIHGTVLKVFNEWYKKSGEYWKGNSRVSANNPAFNAYFDYQIAHFIQQLVGQNVNIVATREGVMTLDHYIEYEWIRMKKYFKAVEKISIGSDSKAYSIRQSSAKVF